jgi:hypothetical protein
MWKLSNENSERKVYTNSVTSSQCTINKLYTDKDGNTWWGFADLFLIPYTRQFAAQKISSLYQVGLTKEDITAHVSKLKTLAKSVDNEKYEKIYAEALDFESKSQTATDPVKQMSSLVCVYYLLNDEHIDSFNGAIQSQKMSLLENDPELHTFFLRKQIEDMERCTAASGLISQIASQTLNGK